MVPLYKCYLTYIFSELKECLTSPKTFLVDNDSIFSDLTPFRGRRKKKGGACKLGVQVPLRLENERTLSSPAVSFTMSKTSILAMGITIVVS